MNPFAFYAGVVAPVGAVLLVNTCMYGFTIVQLVRYTLLKARLARARERARKCSSFSTNKSSREFGPSAPKRTSIVKSSSRDRDRKRSDADSSETHETSVERTISSPTSSSAGACSSSASATSTLSPDASGHEATPVGAMQARRGARIRSLFGSLARHRPRRSRNTTLATATARARASAPEPLTAISPEPTAEQKASTLPLPTNANALTLRLTHMHNACTPPAANTYTLGESGEYEVDALKPVEPLDPRKRRRSAVEAQAPSEQSRATRATAAGVSSTDNTQRHQGASHGDAELEASAIGNPRTNNNVGSASMEPVPLSTESASTEHKVTRTKCTRFRHSSEPERTSNERRSLLEILLPPPPLPPAEEDEEEGEVDEPEITAGEEQVENGNENGNGNEEEDGEEEHDTKVDPVEVAADKPAAHALTVFTSLDDTRTSEQSATPSPSDSGLSSTAPSYRSGSDHSGSSLDRRQSQSSSAIVGLEERKKPPADVEAAAPEARGRRRRERAAASSRSDARRGRANTVEPSVYVMVGLHMKTALGLLVVLGLTWLFAAFAVGAAAPAFTYLFTILNSLTGLFVLLLYGVFKRDVKLAVCKQCRRARDPHVVQRGAVARPRALTRTEAAAAGQLATSLPTLTSNDSNSERKSSNGTPSLNAANRLNHYIVKDTELPFALNRTDHRATEPIPDANAVLLPHPKHLELCIAKLTERGLEATTSSTSSASSSTAISSSSSSTPRETSPTPRTPVRTSSQTDGKLMPINKTEIKVFMERTCISPVMRTPSSASSVLTQSAASSERAEWPTSTSTSIVEQQQPQPATSLTRSLSLPVSSQHPEMGVAETDVKCKCSTGAEADHNENTAHHGLHEHQHHRHRYYRHRHQHHQSDRAVSASRTSGFHYESSRDEHKSARIWVNGQKLHK